MLFIRRIMEQLRPLPFRVAVHHFTNPLINGRPMGVTRGFGLNVLHTHRDGFDLAVVTDNERPTPRTYLIMALTNDTVAELYFVDPGGSMQLELSRILVSGVERLGGRYFKVEVQ